ncbi:hypothetical protein BC833DRAFT_635642 [Globomyces pollinis-pini]|nr:hypothetical protein BC833DRAFT_635642 [Globomyces pollinis-pini]
MSWKGFTKAVSRLPAMISKSAGGQGSKDEEYLQLEDQFKHIEKFGKKLAADSKAFKDGLSKMLEKQTSLAKTFTTIYLPLTDNDEAAFELQSNTPQTDFLKAMTTATITLENDLEQIERLVVAPTLEFIGILEKINKMMVKRSHKLLDYDRHGETVHKLREKVRTAAEEKKLAQAEVDFDQASRIFNAINIQLKQDLSVFLSLRKDFIEPCLLTFYNYQVRVYQTLYTIFYEIGNAKFNLNTSALDGFKDCQDETDRLFNQLTITKPMVYKASMGESPPAYDVGGTANPAPLTFARPSAELGRASTEKPRPLPTEPSSSSYQPRVDMVLALYDFEAQAPGDLSFKRDDKIIVLERKADANDWWIGRIGDREGQFPGNYVVDL